MHFNQFMHHLEYVALQVLLFFPYQFHLLQMKLDDVEPIFFVVDLVLFYMRRSLSR